MSTKEIFGRMLRLAIKESTALVWEYATDHHRFTPRTGNLERAVQMEIGGAVGTVYLDEGIAPYGPAIHNGAAARVIVPKGRKALRWADGGQFIFAKKVHWPGIRPDPFIYQALEDNRKEVEETFDHYTDLALLEIMKSIGKAKP